MKRGYVVHVRPAQGGDGWVVVAGNGIVVRTFRERDAVMSARDLLYELGGGEAVIHRLTGEIEASDQVDG